MNLNVTKFEAREGDANRANGSHNGRFPYGPFAKARIHFWLEGQTILENFFNRGNEPHALVKPFILPMALKAMGLPEDTKATWSRTAGCRCGCSPAFIVEAPNPKGFTFYVTVALTESVVAEEVADAVA